MSVPYVGPAPKPVNLPAVRVVDAHSLAHRKLSKAARACEAADILDGFTTLQNLTIRLVVVAAEGVSVASVVSARRLTPAQRFAVRLGERPLVLPKPVQALPAPVTAQTKLAELVTEVGTVDGVIEMLIKLDRASAA
jgi:hypothetical protein